MSQLKMEDVHASLIDNGVATVDQTMTKEKAFWPFFSTNINVTIWLFGALVAAQGMGVAWGFTAIILGNLIGALPSALTATMGPQTRLSQVEASRFAFGAMGKRLPSLLNWVSSIGWDAINNIPAALALIALVTMAGVNVTFWIMLAVLSVIQMVIAVYGHHVVQVVAKYTGYLLLVLFLLVGFVAISNNHVAAPETGFTAKGFLLAVSLIALNGASFASYSSDYTRYLPAETPKKMIFWRVFLGIISASVVVEVFGLLTASAIQDQTPEGVIHGLQALTGSFAPLVLLAVALGTITANAFNDNSGAYCLVSAGIHLPRPVSAAIAAGLGFILAAWSAGQFSGLVENFILLLFYWIAPWTAIVLVHWFKTGMEERAYSQGWRPAATIFCVVTVVTVGLFASNDIYTGPVAKLLDGADIGYYVGFFAAGFWYWLSLRKTPKESPAS